MYHKVKNTLAGLGMAAAFVVVGLLFSEPVPAEAASPAGSSASAVSTDEVIAQALAQVILSLAQAELADADSIDAHLQAEAPEASDTTPSTAHSRSHPRLNFGMPYYSFGALLPRRRES